VLVLSVIWALTVPQPDVLISGDGHNVGVRGKDGRLHLMRTANPHYIGSPVFANLRHCPRLAA
jgi:competence protein ComEC